MNMFLLCPLLYTLKNILQLSPVHPILYCTSVYKIFSQLKKKLAKTQIISESKY